MDRAVVIRRRVRQGRRGGAVRIRFFSRRKTIAPDFSSEEGRAYTGYRRMFGEPSPEDGRELDDRDDSIDRGNLSFNHYAGIPKRLLRLTKLK